MQTEIWLRIVVLAWIVAGILSYGNLCKHFSDRAQTKPSVLDTVCCLVSIVFGPAGLIALLTSNIKVSFTSLSFNPFPKSKE